MDTPDRDGPPDGDFARYVERLTGGAGEPGRVGAGGPAGQRARSRAAVPAATGGAAPPGAVGRHASAGQRTRAGQREPAGQHVSAGRREPAGPQGLAEEARQALQRAAGQARTQAGTRPADDALRAAGRSAARRLSRWLAIGGFALVAAALLDLSPALSPLPGFTLLVLSFMLHRLSTR